MTSFDLEKLLQQQEKILKEDFSVKHLYLVGSCLEGFNLDKSDINLIVELEEGVTDYLSKHAELLMFFEDVCDYEIQLTILRPMRSLLTENALKEKNEIF